MAHIPVRILNWVVPTDSLALRGHQACSASSPCKHPPTTRWPESRSRCVEASFVGSNTGEECLPRRQATPVPDLSESPAQHAQCSSLLSRPDASRHGLPKLTSAALTQPPPCRCVSAYHTLRRCRVGGRTADCYPLQRLLECNPTSSCIGTGLASCEGVPLSLPAGRCGMTDN